MTIDQQELSRLLQETADQAAPPSFTAQELTRRAARARARISTATFGTVAAIAAVAIAVAVVVPHALSGRSQTGPESIPPPPPPIQASYSVTVNGRMQEVPFGSGAADYVIKPGENLSISVDMTIPTGTTVTVTGLWMGIINTALTPRPNSALYMDMAPLLVAEPRASIGPGTYKFTLHWVAPADLRPGDSRQLSVEMAEPDGEENPIIAVFNVPDSSLTY
jgi:hypothetical protein